MKLIYKLFLLALFFSLPAIAEKDCGWNLRTTPGGEANPYCTGNKETDDKIHKCLVERVVSNEKYIREDLVEMGEYSSPEEVPDGIAQPPGMHDIIAEDCYIEITGLDSPLRVNK